MKRIKEKIKKKFIKNKRDEISFLEHQLEFKKTYNAMFVAALSLVAGLFWKDAINSILDFLPLPEFDNMFGKLLIAIIVSGAIVLGIVYLNLRTRELEEKIKEDKELIAKRNKKR